MQWQRWCWLLIALGFAGAGSGAPTKGGYFAPQKVRVESGETFQFKESFRANERACIFVEGDHDPVVDVQIQVFDMSDNLVAEDKQGGDVVAAIWYPTRDADYRIAIRHSGAQYNAFRIVLK